MPSAPSASAPPPDLSPVAPLSAGDVADGSSPQRPTSSRTAQPARDRAAGDSAGEHAPADECSFERVVAVHPAASNSGDLARAIQPGNAIAGGAQHICLQIGLQAAECLPSENAQADRDQRTGPRIEQ